MKLSNLIPVSILLLPPRTQAYQAVHTQDGCEIANPHYVPTCDPRACAASPWVSCRGRIRPPDCAEFGFIGEPVCEGCVCRLRVRKVEKGKKPPNLDEGVIVEGKDKKAVSQVASKRTKIHRSL